MKTKTLLSVFFICAIGLTIASLPMSSLAISAEENDISIKRGEKIVMNYCALCHGGEDGKLSGKMMDDIPKLVGTIHTSNITNNTEKGIGKYTKEQSRVLLRTRVKAYG
jgi:mono/diheme cytochrome c family protein